MLMKHFYTTALSLVLFCILIGGSATSAKTWTVDDDGPADFSKIQDAVDAASHGDTIIVRDGIYIENIDVDKRLTIESENGSPNCVVEALDPWDDVFYVTADYVNVRGFTLKGSTHIASGICLHYADYCNVSNNICSSNYNGIHLICSNKNIISNNICSYNDDDGIDLWHSNYNRISNNNCSNNSAMGIHHEVSNKNIISNNNCSCNAFGIYLFDSDENSISINNCLNNGVGIYLEASSNNNSISNNDCSLNQGGGISLHYSNNNSISNNNCLNNDDYGIFLWYSNNNVIYLNNFINNSHNFDYYESTNIWNTTEKITYTYKDKTYMNYMGNYWSDYTGVDDDRNGIGDTPYCIDTDKDYHPLVESFENYFFIPMSTITPTPIPSPTPTPAGFETIFAIIGFLMVAYVLRRRNK